MMNQSHAAGGGNSYSMQGVMEFLREQEVKAQEREVKLLNEKRQLEERVKQLEDELAK